MGAGVVGVAMVPVVDLAAEVPKIGTDRITIHIRCTEGTFALDHHLNQPLATQTVVQVTRYRIKM